MRGFLNLPTWQRLSIGLSLTVFMFGLIWWMQGEEAKREATMMGLCWDASGQAHYPEGMDRDANCTTPKPLSWKKSPKLVYWDFDKEFDGFKESHDDAIKYANDGLEEVHFVKTDNKAAADIIITHGSANVGNGAMSASHKKTDDRIVCTITVKKPGNTREWFLEEEHELFHCVGLAHDRSGIMSLRLAEGDQMRVWHLHPVDQDAILSSLRPEEQSGASAP
jgi:hypothetical protein